MISFIFVGSNCTLLKDHLIWETETSGVQGGEVIFTPTYEHCLGRITATNSSTNLSDTCMITEWISNPTATGDAGTLVLNGV